MTTQFCPDCLDRLAEADAAYTKDGTRKTVPATPGACCAIYWRGFVDGQRARAEWVEKARALLGEARCYVSCDVYSNEDYGPEARKLYDELCLFGADQLDKEYP